jgi:peptidyl-prolyl cis-trans isomerase SurA
MTFRQKILTLAVMTLAAQTLQAQGLRVPAATPSAPAASPASVTTQADHIVAVVNSDPITRGDVREEMSRIAMQLQQQGRPVPSGAGFASEVLESLINRKAQLQHAQETGVRIEESAINQAELNIALQNQFDVAELHRRVVRDGVSVKQFRATLADQITLQRLREREVDSRVRVSDQEVEQYQNEQRTVVDLSTLQLNLAHILVSVPENASAIQIEALRVRAQRALDRAKAGEDFAALVREFSEASEVKNGGQLGLRPASRYPELFVQATQLLAVGDLAELVRSAAGFHVLKVIEKVVPGAPTAAVTQSRARHILLVPGASLSEAQARAQLADFKKRVLVQTE